MKHPNSLKSIDRQQNRENDDLVDTDIEMGTHTEVKNNQLSTSESMARKITENLDENVDT